MAPRRTTMRSRSGTKLYAVRDKSGQFKDIQTYKRAHGADLRQKSKAEEDSLEKQVRKVAGDAGTSGKSAAKDAIRSVQKAGKRAVKQVASLESAGRRLVKSAI